MLTDRSRSGGHVADVLGPLNLLYPMTTFAGLLSFIMWLWASSVELMVAFACLYGFCSGIFISLMPAAASQITPPDRLGARLGAISSLNAISVFVGSPIAGALIRGDTVAGYRPLILYSVRLSACRMF
jgi:MFS family permease